MKFVLLLLALTLADYEGPSYPTIIPISSTIILVQCTAHSREYVRDRCKRFEPMHPTCSGMSRYTLTHIEACNQSFNVLVENTVFSASLISHYGSLYSKSFDEPWNLRHPSEE